MTFQRWPTEINVCAEYKRVYQSHALDDKIDYEFSMQTCISAVNVEAATCTNAQWMQISR